MRTIAKPCWLCAALILACVAVGPAWALTPPELPAAAKIDAYLRQQMLERRIPGMQVAIVKDQRVVLLKSYGVANLQTPVPVTDQTVFSINSITKAFTGIEAMKLIQAQRLDPGATVSTYLDDLPEAWRSVTIRQLLAHMSGLPDINNAPFAARGADQASVWAWTKSRPMLFAPGERFHYCQTNYTLLQRIINHLNGHAPDATLADPQFQLAAMAHSGYGDADDVIANKAPSYRYTYASAQDPGSLRAINEYFQPFHRASAGINSTAEDMARWIIAVQGRRLLNDDSLKTLWTPVAFNNGTLGQWGLGWEVLDRPGHRAVGMTGGSRAAFFIYPEDKLAVVILTNLAGAYPEDLIDQVVALTDPNFKLTGVPLLRAELERRGFERSQDAMAALRRADPAFRPAEAELNDWGYRLLKGGKPRQGLEVLRIVANLYPDSANAYDSLAEAYASNGDTNQAIVNYRRSLQLDPKNTNAIQWLNKLEASVAPVLADKHKD